MAASFTEKHRFSPGSSDYHLRGQPGSDMLIKESEGPHANETCRRKVSLHQGNDRKECRVIGILSDREDARGYTYERSREARLRKVSNRNGCSTMLITNELSHKVGVLKIASSVI